MKEVSVVIPTFDRVGLLKRALNSVLAQTYKNYEIIVVQNGSVEYSKSLLSSSEFKSQSIKYLHTMDPGSSNARNLGIKHSESKYVAFLDDDDYWLPNKLAVQMKALRENSNVGLISCNAIEYDQNGRERLVTKQINQEIRLKDMLSNGCLIHSLSGVIVKRECFKKLGLFNNDYAIADDYEFYLRFLRKYKMLSIGDVLYKYYKHAYSLSANRKRMSFQSAVILKKSSAYLTHSNKNDVNAGISNYLNNYFSYLLEDLSKGKYWETGIGCFKVLSYFPLCGMDILISKNKVMIYRIFKPYEMMITALLKGSILKFITVSKNASE